MWDAKVGDKVVCIRKAPTGKKPRAYAHLEKSPTVGETYTIRAISNGYGKFSDRIYIQVEEIINPILAYQDGLDPGEMSFHLARFRPLKNATIDNLIKIALDPNVPMIQSNTPGWDKSVKKVKENVD